MDTRALWLRSSTGARDAGERLWSWGSRTAQGSPPARLWRGSLQFRVVTSTLVLSGLLVTLLLVVVTNLVVSGLVSSQRAAAVAETRSGLRTLGVALGEGPVSGEDLSRDMVSLVNTLSGKGSQAGLFDVVLVPPSGTVSAVSSGAAGLDQLPVSLREAVRGGGLVHLQYVTLTQPGGGDGPGLVVGGTAGSTFGPFALYYLFPLSETSDTAALVQRTMITAGVVLVVLLASVAALVTRQVVTPVRQARSNAEKLAAGDLDVRMSVKGEDDLASLATSFNHMADSLQNQIAELERLSDVQRGFVSDVSHELRTPMTTLRMAADVMYSARSEFPPDLSRAAELLDAEVDRFEKLLTDLLEISRHDANVAVLDPEWLDVGSLVDRLVAATRPLAQRQGCEIRLSVAEGPLMAEIDATRFERIMRNLLGNALEHGRGRPVEVQVAGDAEAVAVVVADSGRGLRPGEAGLVFNRFYRGDSSRARTIGGTGLGLAISFEDTRLHGGWLQAWGEPGEGARFRLTVPVHAGGELSTSPLPLEPEPWRSAEQATRSVRVLSVSEAGS